MIPVDSRRSRFLVVRHWKTEGALASLHVDHEAMDECARNVACLCNLSSSIPRAQLPKEKPFFTSRAWDQQPSPLAAFLRDFWSELGSGDPKMIHRQTIEAERKDSIGFL